MTISKIALEEHLAPPENMDATRYMGAVSPGPGKPFQVRSSSPADLLAEMDANGIEMSVLSLRSSTIESTPLKQTAIELARRSNDYLAQVVAKHPTRFQAFAALPMQDPEAAAHELLRSVRELGFRGAMVKGFSQVGDTAAYYDLPQYWDFWGTVESLGVPFYLHPRYPLKTGMEAMEGHPWLRGSVWFFGVETATHALRLMASGLFDQYPKLTIILGHLGETLPNVIWRIDHRLKGESANIPAKKTFTDYLRNNFYVTTSGNFYTPALTNAIATMGADRILFSVDFPYEQTHEAAEWFDHAEIGDTDRTKIARTNAQKLLKLNVARASA